MKKIKTLHKFTDANIDGEKLEKAASDVLREDIENKMISEKEE